MKQFEHDILHDFEVLFTDSSEYFHYENCRLLEEGGYTSFIKFDENGDYVEHIMHPTRNIHRIKVRR